MRRSVPTLFALALLLTSVEPSWALFDGSENPDIDDGAPTFKVPLLHGGEFDLDSFGTKWVKRFVKGLDFEITYPIVVDKRREVADKYGVSVLPTTVVIDRAGKVIAYHVGYSPGDESEIEQQVREALGSGNP